MHKILYYLYDYVAFNEGSGGGAEIQVCLISKHEKYVEITGVPRYLMLLEDGISTDPSCSTGYWHEAKIKL